jgi:GNAT superfamily N-acetyltransferase
MASNGDARAGASTRIRRAAVSDAERLTALAHAAKGHWGYPSRWLRLWRDDLSVSSSFIRSHPVYCAVRAGQVIGFYALSRRRTRFELEHMWVDPAHMGAGVGRRLFRHALRTTRAAQGTTLRIASDPHAEEFYRRLGATRVGEVASSPAGRKLPLLEVTVRVPAARARVCR